MDIVAPLLEGVRLRKREAATLELPKRTRQMLADAVDANPAQTASQWDIVKTVFGKN
jgi:hypothetical protein